MSTTSIIRFPAVKSRVGLSKSTLYNRIAQGEFPSPVKLGGRAVGWIESEVQRWLEQRIEASRATTATAAPTRVRRTKSR